MTGKSCHPSRCIGKGGGSRKPVSADTVNPCGLDIDIVKTGFRKFRHIFVIAQGAGDAAYPKLYV